jgi:hypothetical protein
MCVIYVLMCVIYVLMCVMCFTCVDVCHLLFAVIYPVMGVDYSQTPPLDTDKVLQWVKEAAPNTNMSIDSWVLEIEQYKQDCADGTIKGGCATADLGSAAVVSDGVLSIKHKPVSSNGGSDAAAGPATGSPAAGVEATTAVTAATTATRHAPGLDKPMSAERVRQLQTLMGAEDHLRMFLTRKLLKARVAARRATLRASFEAQFVCLDDPLRVKKKDSGHHQRAPQRQQATNAAAPRVGEVAKGEEDEDMGLLDGLEDEQKDAAEAAEGPAGLSAAVDPTSVSADSAAAGTELEKAGEHAESPQEPKCSAPSSQLEQDGAVAVDAPAHSSTSPATDATANSTSGMPKSEIEPASRSPAASRGAAGSAAHNRGGASHAEQLPKQQPLLVEELMAEFSVEHSEQAQQLWQVSCLAVVGMLGDICLLANSAWQKLSACSP